MARLFKIVKILFVITAFSVIQSCIAIIGGCNCDETIYYYTPNKLEIANIDNSGRYPGILEVNVMHRSAIAFSISLYDSTDSYLYSSLNAKHNNQLNLGFATASAWLCDCSLMYLPTPSVQDFRIYTIFDINSDIKSGDDITEYFVGQEQYGSHLDLYSPLLEVINDQNVTPTMESAIRFNAFLQVPIKNEQAQFTVFFQLSDGSEIELNTAIIDIID
jgi:hypothetical protein